MKKITFFFLLLTISFGYSQVVLEDFEGTTNFMGFEGLGGANVVANPSMDANNVSAMAGQMIVVQAGQPWQGANLVMQDNYLDVTTPATQPVTVNVYSTVAFDMLAKVVDGQNGAPDSAVDASHGGTGWETLTFTFNNPLDSTTMPASGEYGTIAFFPNWNGSGWHDPEIEITIYLDDITAFAGAPIGPTCTDGIMNGDETGIDCGGTSCAPCAVPPTAAAPTPPARAAADVMSFYSDAYTDITIGNFDAGWCGAPSVSEVMIAGNATQHYSGQACQGIDFSANKQDASGFTHAHFDFYTSDTDLTGKVFNVKFVDFGGGATEVPANTIEVNINTGTTPAIATGTWVSVDYILPQSLVTSLGDLAQIGITSNLANVWYDNLYLHKGTTLSTDEFSTAQFSVYPNPTAGNWNIKSNSTINTITVYDVLGKQVQTITPNTDTAEINALSLNSGLYFAKIVGNNGSKTIKLIKE